MRTSDFTGLDDQALLARARDGDVDAFGALIERHQRAALRVAAVITGSTEEACDIVQDALLNVHRGLATYNATGSVRSWMLRAVANQAKNHLRGRTRRLHRDDRYTGLQLRSADGADHAALEHIDHERLAGALARLRGDDRAVLGCRFIAGLSEHETSEVLGIAVGTVKSRSSRALQRLRVEFGEEQS